MKAAEIRESFLAYFESKDHKRLPSSSLIPLDDPTLLFTNAGMNQFKDVFLGQRKVDYKRATTSQKCIRAGGKHNDLENVGETARHHTFFEMLGNFSFGDYFKEDAIKFAWDYIRNTLKIPADRLYATVYHKDDEAFALWEKIAPELKNGRIMRFGEKDNFWSMGETGPCGPCSEIHVDRGEQYGKNAMVNDDGDRFMEIWNLVFMQFDRDASGKMTPLPKPSVDTGGGLERMAMVMQKVDSNYDTDLFAPLLSAIIDLTGREYHRDKRGLSHRVVADHIRALTFAIADGGIPSNEGRGYVLRRILRRAARHGRLLGKHDPFIYKLASVLVDTMGHQFPEIKAQAEHVALVIKSEEESFGETLDRGIEIFDKIVERLRSKNQKLIPGEEVFKLYDTYGFPVDMTEVMAREQGLTVDMPGFEKSLNEQKQRSKESGAFSANIVIPAKNVAPTRYVGYNDAWESRSKVLSVSRADKYQQVILDVTPFYAESGGQIGDTGSLKMNGHDLVVLDTLKSGDYAVHLLESTTNVAEKIEGAEVVARVDGVRQKHTQRNHTATHLLHKALRTVLGEHVQQKGSLVAPDRLRFDFANFKAMTEEEIREVERLVNEQILLNRPVKWDNYPIEEAKKLGAMALFGEKYGDVVRMVEVEGYSRELCGGTHVQATGEIGLFIIIAETAIAAGIRRIEALTGAGAFEYLRNVKNTVDSAARALKMPEGKIVERVEELLEESKKLKKELEKTQAESAAGEIEKLFRSNAQDIRGVKVLVHTFDGKDQLNAYADFVKSLSYPASGIFYNPAGQYAITASDSALKMKLQPRELIKDLNTAFGGRGGGRDYFVQGAGPKPLDEALVKSTVLPLIEKALS